MPGIIIQPISSIAWWSPAGGIPANTPESKIGFGGTSVSGMMAPDAGEFFGLAVSWSAPITAGDVEVRATIDNIPLTAWHLIGPGPLDALFRIVDANRFFQVGQRLGVNARSSAALLPTPLSVIVVPSVVYYRGVSTDQSI